MCGAELKIMVEQLKTTADQLETIHTNDAYLCDICLANMECIVKMLRLYKTNQASVDKQLNT